MFSSLLLPVATLLVLTATAPASALAGSSSLSLTDRMLEAGGIIDSSTHRMLEAGGINDYTSFPFSMSNYTNPNDTYAYSAEVEQATSISSSDFNNSPDYFIESGTTPIVLFALGVVAVVLFNLLLCCGITKICSEKATALQHVSCGEYAFTIMFAAFTIILFLATHILYLGYSDVVDGFDIMRTSSTAIGDGFKPINAEIDNLDANIDILLPLCASYGCRTVLLEDSVEYMTDDIGKVDDYTSDVNAGIDLMEMFVTLIMFAMYACLMVAIIVYILTELCCKTKPCGAILIGNFSFVIVAAIGVLWMSLTSITADYCYENPSYNTIDALSASKGQMYLAWYSSCVSGENPIFRYINATETANNIVINYVGSNTSSESQEILNQTSLISSDLMALTRATVASCSPVQSGLLSLLNDGVCDSFFQGVRVIWICQVAACVSLFFLMLTGGIMGRYAKDNNAQSLVVPQNQVDQMKQEQAEAATNGMGGGDDDQEMSVRKGGGGDIEMRVDGDADAAY